MSDLLSFPVLPGQGWSVFKTPEFACRKQRAVSGREVRLLDQVIPTLRWKLTYPVLRDSNDGRAAAPWAYTEMQTMETFFGQMLGSDGVFLFDDPTDDAVMGARIGTGNGSEDTFLLALAFFTLGATVVETIKVYLNGVLQLTSAYFVNDNGSITFGTAPGGGVVVTVDLTYKYRCRFVDDTLNFENFLFDLWELQEVNLLSLVDFEGVFNFLTSDHDVILDSDHDVHLMP